MNVLIKKKKNITYQLQFNDKNKKVKNDKKQKKNINRIICMQCVHGHT